MQITLKHNPQFAIRSHGWPLLAPFTVAGHSLAWPQECPTGLVCSVKVSWRPEGQVLRVQTRPHGTLQEDEKAFIRNVVCRIFRADECFDEFWNKCKDDDILGECRRLKAGPLMRSACVFDDVVKTMCTINCHWRNTKRMVVALCSALGKPCLNETDRYTFPSVNVVARCSASRINNLRLGFRAEWIHKFAKQVESGTIDLASWERCEDAIVLHEKIRTVKGLGPYAINHMLMLLGHYQQIPCDSEVCAYLGLPSKTRQSKVEKVAVERYGKWGKHAFLAYKFERVFQKVNYVDS